jgi:hypothetical protein
LDLYHYKKESFLLRNQNCKSKEIIDQETLLRQKLDDLKEDLGDELTNFIASFTIILPESPEVPVVSDDQQRENAFIQSTILGVNLARAKLDEAG